MRGLTQLLAGIELSDAERKRVTSLLEAEAGKLQAMVGVLLDLERLPLRDFREAAALVDLGTLTAARVAFLRASTDRELIMSTVPEVPVHADAALLERVIDNLVGNALKYSPAPSPVHIEVKEQDHTAILEVADHGPGIAAEDRERIFQRFYRGSTAAGTQGLGLGLALVTEVAKWHGGAVSVEGSRFRFVLPKAETV